MRVVLCYDLKERHVREIRAVAPSADVFAAQQETIARELLEADIFCGHAKVPVDWDEVVRRGRLRWIQSSAAGLDHCLVPSVVASDIVVTSASGVLADQVAEHTLALVTALCRGLPKFFRAQQARQFVRLPTRDLHDATVGIVGFGGVGRRVAELLRPFRARMLATDWFPVDEPDYVESLWPPERLFDLLGEIDILILAAPLTDSTRGMIDRQALSLMKSTALLINVARGPLVVERDLVDALKSSQIAGAALDVTEVEPLPNSSELWDLPNCIITPHVGGQCARRADNMTRFFCENLARYLSGEPLWNLVDKSLGFPSPLSRRR